jgi:hypothetical protein
MAGDPRKAAICRMVLNTLLIAGVCVLASCGTPRRASEAASTDFAVLKQAATPDDEVPPQVATALHESVEPEFTVSDIGAARRVLANEPGWLVPAADGELCIVRVVYPVAAGISSSTPEPSTSRLCVPEPTAVLGKLVLTHSLSPILQDRQGDIQVIGVVPDGITSVSIVSQNQHSLNVDVLRNAYSAVVVDPETVRFHGPRRIADPVRLVIPSASKNEAPRR